MKWFIIKLLLTEEERLAIRQSIWLEEERERTGLSLDRQEAASFLYHINKKLMCKMDDF